MTEIQTALDALNQYLHAVETRSFSLPAGVVAWQVDNEGELAELLLSDLQVISRHLQDIA